jgi:hypothetical protein
LIREEPAGQPNRLAYFSCPEKEIPMYRMALTLTGYDDNSTDVYLFDVEDTVDFEDALDQAVMAWLRTPAADSILSDQDGSYYWYEVLDVMDAENWKPFGIYPVGRPIVYEKEKREGLVKLLELVRVQSDPDHDNFQDGHLIDAADYQLGNH